MIAELLLQSFEKQTSPTVSFDSKRCLRSRLNTNTCDLCLSLCPKRALTLSGRKIVFEAEHCSGCMACVSGCPNDAFDCGFDHLSFFSALHGNGDNEPIVLSCGRSSLAAYGQPIHVPCIGILSEPALAAMHCVATRDFYLDVRHCVSCGNGKVLDLLYSMVQGIIQKKGAADLRFHYLTGNNPQEGCSGNQRRFFLRMTSNSLKDFGRATTAFLGQPKTAAEEKPEEKQTTAIRRLLREAFNSLPRNAVQEKQLLLSYNHTLTANENCDCCPICTGMCPTGALKRQRDSTGKHLIFISSRCTGCGLCAAFCRKEALVLRPGFRNDPQIALRIASV